jgi:hypothetical protein
VSWIDAFRVFMSIVGTSVVAFVVFQIWKVIRDAGEETPAPDGRTVDKNDPGVRFQVISRATAPIFATLLLSVVAVVILIAVLPIEADTRGKLWLAYCFLVMLPLFIGMIVRSHLALRDFNRADS